jgi:flagellar biogenesis protein FliO
LPSRGDIAPTERTEFHEGRVLMLPILALVSDLAAHPAREGPDWNRYVLLCALLLVVLGALAWGMRALVAGSARIGGARRSLQVIDVLSLGGKQRVCVVRCYDRTFALGVGDKEVGLIAEIDAEASMPKANAAPNGGAFGAVLACWTGRDRVRPEDLS